MKNQSKIKDIILFIARIIFGVIFLYSGFVKSVDPLGTTYKIADYLEAFSLLPEGDFSTFPYALLLITIELAIGFNFLFNIHLKITSVVASIFMLIMTPLTLYLAIENPVTDCGCFGDAVVLTNWETFYKNLGICALLILIIFLQKSNKPLISGWKATLATFIPIIFSLGMCMYCYYYLPIIDFRPYKIGNNIIEGMETPADAPKDKYETLIYLSKDGQEKAFSLEEYPADDTSWVFVRQESKLIEQGYVPPIHDFSITTDQGDITDIVLSNPGYTLLVVTHKLEKINTKNIDLVKEAISNIEEFGVEIIWLTSSNSDIIENFKKQYNIDYTFGATDDITLKTIVRANPGLVLIKDAVIIEKWHNNALPTKDELNKLIN